MCLRICGDAGVTWNNIATGCANLCRLVFAFALCHACDAHIPEHLNSTGTRVSMEALFWFVSLPHTVSVCFCVFFKSRNLLLTNLLTGLQPWYWMPTYYSSSVTYVLYIITFLNQQSAYLQSVKRSRKMCCQSITEKVRRQNILADKTMCSLKTVIRFDEGHDVIQYFWPVKYQCGDIYSNSTVHTL